MKKLTKYNTKKNRHKLSKWLRTIPVGAAILLVSPILLGGCSEKGQGNPVSPTVEETVTLNDNVSIENNEIDDNNTIDEPTKNADIEDFETVETDPVETLESIDETDEKEQNDGNSTDKSSDKDSSDKNNNDKESNKKDSSSGSSSSSETSGTNNSTANSVIAGQPAQDTTPTNSGNTHSGKATYYGAGPGGCCNLDEYENVYYTVAMNRPDYNSMNLAGAYLEVTDKDGDKINVMVTNELPEGNSGDLDLSIQAFGAIEPLETGIMNVTWKIIPLPTSEPIYYKFKSGSSQYWVEVQVRNHRYPIKSVEYLNANGEYVALERKAYNYYCAPSGMGSAGPYTFRVTDMYGHVLVDSNIPLDTSESLIPGAANFPY